MAERDGYIPGVPCWVDTSQPDPEAAVAFYRGLFGCELEDTMPAGSPGSYFIGRIRGGDGRSEERRVGKEGRSRWVPDPLKKKKKSPVVGLFMINRIARKIYLGTVCLQW